MDLREGNVVIEDNLNPYEIPKQLWNLIKKQFDKYDVSVSRSSPSKRVDKPTIVWRIFDRRKGYANRNFGKLGSISANIPREALGDQTYRVQDFEIHTITYEWKVFAVSSETADEIAWMLESLLPQAAEVIAKNTNSGMTFNFLSQSADNDLSSRQAEEIQDRTLRFICQTHIYLDKILPELHSINANIALGFAYTFLEKDSREADDDSLFIIEPTLESQRITRIGKISRFVGVQEVLCIPNIDYRIEKDEDTKNLYIVWNDETGRPPSLGERFRVEYGFSTVINQQHVE